MQHRVQVGLGRQRSLLALLSLLVLAGWCQAKPEASKALEEGLWDAAPRPRMPIPRAAGPITVDGKLDEAAWQSASVFTQFTRTTGQTGSALWGVDTAQAATRVAVCYDDQCLYLGWDLEEPYVDVLKAQTKDRDGSVWFDDCTEFMVDANQDAKRLVHFIWSALGVTYDADPTRGGSGWNCAGQKLAVSKDLAAKRWYVEVSLPLTELNVGPTTPGSVWRLNLGRERYASAYKALQENSLWAGQAEGSFEMPARFGDMVFSDLAVGDLALPSGHLGTSQAAFGLCSGKARTVTVEARSTAGQALVAPAKTITLEAGKPAFVQLEFGTSALGPGIVYLLVKDGEQTLACLRRAYYVRDLPTVLKKHLDRMEAILAGSTKGTQLEASAQEKLPQMRKLLGDLEGFVKTQVAKPVTPESIKAWDDFGKQVDAFSASGTYVVWSISPWVKITEREMPESLQSNAGVTLAAAQDETEYGAFMVSNLTAEPLTVRIADLSNVRPPHLRLLSSPIWPLKGIAEQNPEAAHFQGMIVDPERVAAGAPSSGAPLLTLSEWGEVYIAPFGSKRVWVRVDTHGLKPGKYGGSFRVLPLNQRYAPTGVGFALEVWPFAIPAKTPLPLYLWDYASQPAQLDDLAAHRVSHFMINCDPEVIRKGPQQVQDKAARGQLIGSYGIIHEFQKAAEKQGPKRGTDAYLQGFAKYLNDWVEAVKAAGIKLDTVALQHFDEPYGDATQKILELGPVFRREQPQLKLVITCMTPFPELQQLGPYCDIYGFRGDVLYEPFTSFLRAEQQKGKQVWSFTCATPVADLDPLSYWRLRPWWAFKQNLDGIMIFAWAYLVHVDHDVPNTAPVPTAGYEAIAQGMEDYCLLYLLRQAIADATKAGKADAAKAAQTVLDTALTEVVQKPNPQLTEAALAQRLEAQRAKLGAELVRVRQLLGAP